MRALRNLFLLALAAAVSYLVLLYEPGAPLVPEAKRRPAPPIAVVPDVPLPQPVAVGEVEAPAPPEPERMRPAPPEDAPPAPEPAAAPPPPESGTPEGSGEARGDPPAPPPPPADKPSPDEGARAEAERVREEIESLARSPELLAEAEAELAGRARHGFRQRFTSHVEAVAAAREFGAPIVLVPRAGLRPGNYHYFRLAGEPPRVESVRERPPLFHKYFDLLGVGYENLSPPLRELRRQVPNRADIEAFGPVILPAQHAVVIARRRAALEEHNRRRGSVRTLGDVREFLLDYVPLEGGGFDIRVVRIEFADGTVWVPDEES